MDELNFVEYVKRMEGYKLTDIKVEKTEDGGLIIRGKPRKFVKEDSSSETVGYRPSFSVTNSQGVLLGKNLGTDPRRDWYISFSSFASELMKQNNYYTAFDTSFEMAVERFKNKYPTLCKDEPCFIQNAPFSMYVLLRHGALVYKYSTDKIKYVPNRNKAYF